MITITDEEEIIKIGHIFLHQETELTLEEVEHMSDFDVYYETRELIKNWNKLPQPHLGNKKLSLAIQGFNIK